MRGELKRSHAGSEVLEQHIQQKLKPSAAQMTLLDEIPGVDWTLAAVIIAELSVDVSVFESVSQLASWAGVCPRSNESAGKRKKQPHSHGQCVPKNCFSRGRPLRSQDQGTYLRDKFYRLNARREYKRAVGL